MERARFASPWLADSLYTACVPASPAPGSPLRAGAVLDEKYRIARVLGSSGMGIVYLAEHLELERPVAVKFLLASALASEDGIARFRREAKALAKIESPNVVRVFDVGSLDGVGPYIVMEYLEGEDVAQILKREGRLSVSRACSLVIQAAKGLASAHAVGVVHRDVKPANLFVVPTADGREMVKVIDFGIAKLASAVDTVTESASFLGSPRFMSPEQVYGDKTIDARTDVWSLAVVLFEALAGKPAFGAESFAKVLTEIAIGKVPTLASFVTDAPLALDAVLAAALQKDAAKRTADVLAFARALAPFVSDARSFPLTPTANRDSIEPDVSTRPARRASPHNLLVEPNPFIGRSSDLQALAEAIESGARLVTLVGTAGTGKTRIALHFGWESLDRWPGGVWFCDLSDASTLAGVAFTVAGALGVPLEKGDPALELAHAIAGRGRCLLILDNFEQVTSEARTTIGQWIERTTEACFVVTSREVLRLDAERVLPLDPLERDEAVSLFEARAQAAKQGFSLTPSTRPVVQALVALLDHLPLAVELAAARVRVMAPASILERMTQRFKLLALPHEHRSRQATLRGALDWSWDLLAKDEQSALEQISVFEGGFTLEAAEAVLSLDELWTVDAVQALVDKSLLRRGRDGRFGLLVSVHEYAREKIDMSQRRAAAEARHGSYYARFGTDDARTSLDSHGGNERRRALLPEIDNLAVAAKRAAMRSDGPTAAHTALAAWTVFEQYGPYAVGIGLLEMALAACGDEGSLRSPLLASLGEARRFSGDTVRAGERLDSALASYRNQGEHQGESIVLRSLGNLLAQQGKLDEARARFQEARVIDSSHGNRRHEAVVLSSLGAVLLSQGQGAEAREFLEQALAIHREVGDRSAEGRTLLHLGFGSQEQGLLEPAIRTFKTALGIHRELGQRRLEAVALCNLGEACCVLGQVEEGIAALREAIDLYTMLGNRRGQGVALAELGAAQSSSQRHDDALASLAQAELHLRAVNDRFQLCMMLATRAELLAAHDVASAKADLGEAETIAASLNLGPNSQPRIRIAKATAAVGMG